ncbi:MAG: hypothetical protein PHF67_02630, partial [Candidatus Nanoarchaeia archaeon]|nr:hypothetical protein [Candidatus Nanoarchaeia archaeon]
MVHKKYIKRGDKVFGPYLYKNYRENGVTKTRYIGACSERKKFNISNALLIVILFLIIMVLVLMGLLKLGILDESFLDLNGGLFSQKPLSASVLVRPRLLNLTLPYGIYEPLCCDNNLKTGNVCYEDDYVNSLDESGAVYCDSGDPVYSGIVQHRLSIRFNNLSINSGDKVQCIIETSGTESQPGNLFALEETPGVLVEQDFYLNYTFNRTSEIVLFDGTALPWYIHNCSIYNISGDLNKSDPVNKRIYVHKSAPWTDLELTKIISCEGGSSGVFMNNIDRCLRDSPENIGSSKEFMYAFNLFGGGTIEGKCYDGIDNDYWGGTDAEDDTCKTWWDSYIDRTTTLLPGFWLGLRSGGILSGASFIFDEDNLNSITLTNTNTFVESTVNNNPHGYMKFRFRNPSMNQNKYNIFLYEVPAASSLTILGNGPGISSLTSSNLRVTLQASGNYTVNLLCDNQYCDDGGYLDIVMIVNFSDYNLDGRYPIGLEFTFTAGPSDTGITQNVYFDSVNGLLNNNESQSSAATAENMCNDSKNNDLDISSDYDYINNTSPPNRIDFSRDCGDKECQGKTGPLLNGQRGICYYQNESLNYPLSCRDGYDNDWNDNYLIDVYGFTNPSLDYKDCKDTDCFRLGGISNDITNNPCPAFENNSEDWCGDGINNDFDSAELGSSSGTHSSSCSFSVDSYIKLEQNSMKYLHTSRIYDLFDCRDFDCKDYDGNISAEGTQKCEYGKELSCEDNFDNDGLQLKDCEIGSPVGRTYAPSYNLHAEYDCSAYCRQNLNAQENGDLCSDGKDNDWDFWYPDASSFYNGIENISGGIDCRWISYNPDEECNLTWMNVSGTGYWQPEKHLDIVQCQLGREFNCVDNFDNDIDRDFSNPQSGWQGKNDSFKVYNTGADCADYDCKNVKDSNGNYKDSTGIYACPINERYSVNSGSSYKDNVSWCFDGIDNDLDGEKDCKDPDCLNAVNPSPGQNGLNNVLVCASYELNSSALLDNNVLTVSPDYCGNLSDDESKVAEDNPAITSGGLTWYNINFN